MHPLYKEIRLMQKYRFKIVGLIILIFVFSVLYSLLDSSHFQGLNPLQDQIKEDIVKKVPYFKEKWATHEYVGEWKRRETPKVCVNK